MPQICFSFQCLTRFLFYDYLLKTYLRLCVNMYLFFGNFSNVRPRYWVSIFQTGALHCFHRFMFIEQFITNAWTSQLWSHKFFILQKLFLCHLKLLSQQYIRYSVKLRTIYKGVEFSKPKNLLFVAFPESFSCSLLLFWTKTLQRNMLKWFIISLFPVSNPIGVHFKLEVAIYFLR